MPEKELIPIHKGRIEIPDEWRRMVEGTRRLFLTYWDQQDEPKDEIKTLLWKPKDPKGIPAEALFAKYLEEFIHDVDDWRDRFKLQSRIFGNTSQINIDAEGKNLFLPSRLMTILGRTRRSLKNCKQTPTTFPDAVYLDFQSKTPFADEAAKWTAISNSHDTDYKIGEKASAIQAPPNLVILPEAS